MRRLFFAVIVGAACGCRAIVGSYEIGDTTSDVGVDGSDASDSSAAIDSSSTTDSGVSFDADGGAATTSCKQIKATSPSAASGPYTLNLPSGDVQAFCDMQIRGGGGYTLVALKSSKTDAAPWTTHAVTMTKTLNDARQDTDAVLDVDWREIGFDEVLYDLGDTPPTTHAVFAMTDAFRAAAKDALFAWSTGPSTSHPDCTVEPDTTSIRGCSPPPTPPGDPPSSIGWLYSPLYTTTSKLCWWGYKGSNGAQNCTTGAAGTGRVWIH